LINICAVKKGTGLKKSSYMTLKLILRLVEEGGKNVVAIFNIFRVQKTVSRRILNLGGRRISLNEICYSY